MSHNPRIKNLKNSIVNVQASQLKSANINANSFTATTISASSYLGIPQSPNAVTLSGNNILTGMNTFTEDIIVNGVTLGSALGNYNTAIGYEAMLSGTGINSDYNIGIGYQAFLNSEGQNNIVIGKEAYQNAINTHQNNIAVGTYSMSSLTGTSEFNIAIGFNSMRYYKNNSFKNIAIGTDAMVDGDSSPWNIGIGNATLSNVSSSQDNIAIGNWALHNLGYNCDGNIGIGFNALYSAKKNSNYNIGIGDSAGRNVSGSFNVFMGIEAGFGFDSGVNLSSASYSTALGYYAMGGIVKGLRNTALGYGAGQVIYGNDNICIGSETQVSGTDNILIGNFKNISRPNINNTLIIRLGSNERMRIDSAGNLGVGTSNPGYKLEVSGTIYSSNGGFRFPDGSVQTTAAIVSSNASTITLTDNTTNITNYIPFSSTATGNSSLLTNSTLKYNASTERLFVSKLAIGAGTPTYDLFCSGNFQITAPSSAAESSISNGGSNVSYLGLSNTYAIIKGKNNTYISYDTNGTTVMTANSLGAVFSDVARPADDGTISLGEAGAKWSEVFATNGTINTSDARQKQQVRDLTTAERAAAIRCKSLLRAYKWNSAVEAKGNSARIHFGILAQDVKTAFEAEGLNADEYGLFCYDEWEAEDELLDPNGKIIKSARPAGNAYGVRYNELLAFIIAAL